MLKNLIIYSLFIIIFIFILLVIYLLFTVVCSLFVKNKNYEKDNKLYRSLFNTWTFIAIKIMRIKIETNGLEKVPKDCKLLFVGNHVSNFDSIITWNVFKNHNISYISKKSNFKIPIFGKIVRRCCFLEIDRENPRNALKTIIKASELLHNQEVSIGVYPEGTRNKIDDKLLPFHNGVFKIAQKAKSSIVVIALEGANNIHKNYPWKKSIVKLNVVDVINEVEVSNLSSQEIGERVKEKLEIAINVEV